jgi:hypothetical protein
MATARRPSSRCCWLVAGLRVCFSFIGDWAGRGETEGAAACLLFSPVRFAGGGLLRDDGLDAVGVLRGWKVPLQALEQDGEVIHQGPVKQSNKGRGLPPGASSQSEPHWDGRGRWKSQPP